MIVIVFALFVFALIYKESTKLKKLTLYINTMKTTSVFKFVFLCKLSNSRGTHKHGTKRSCQLTASRYLLVIKKRAFKKSKFEKKSYFYFIDKNAGHWKLYLQLLKHSLTEKT